jgi:hypothetical protein
MLHADSVVVLPCLELEQLLSSGLIDRFRPILEFHPRIRNILDHTLSVKFLHSDKAKFWRLTLVKHVTYSCP